MSIKKDKISGEIKRYKLERRREEGDRRDSSGEKIGEL
jgi:hypothetical protein